MKIVLLSLKGLGDTLQQIPLIRALARAYPEHKLTVIVPDGASEEVFVNCPYVRTVRIAFRKPGLKLAADTLKLLRFLRAEEFDVSITTFPSNRIWYNLLAFWTGAKLRVTHSYGYARLRTLAFLQNRKVPADPHRNELDQNFALLAPLGLDPEQEKKDLSLWLGDGDLDFARRFIGEHGLSGGGKLIIGVHPSINKNKIYKAWAPGNVRVFAELIDWLDSAFGARTIIFSGPEEADAARSAMELSGSRPVLCSAASITRTGALIKSCALFINTDSGLGHLAASVGTPVITVFGPANPEMTAPYGPQNTVIHCAETCAPCYEYPYSSTYPRLKCRSPKCMERIDLAALKEAASKKLEP